jgi:hypothetical protein
MAVSWLGRQKIQMIKTLRMETGWGLKEVKDFIEEIGEKLADNVTDEYILAMSLYKAIPNRFPAPRDIPEPNFKRLWALVNEAFDDDPEAAELIKFLYTREELREHAVEVVQRQLSCCLNSRFYNVIGDTEVSIFNNSGLETKLGIGKCELRKVLTESFMNWLNTIFKTGDPHGKKGDC